MFGMGWQEILMILVIAVLVIGPEQLPQLARGLGKVMTQFRRATNDLRDQVNREFNQDENLREFKEFQQSVDAEVRSLGHMAQDYVEKEAAKEEAELTKLESEVKDAAGEAKKAVDASQWLPPSDPTPEPAAEVETVTVAPEPAAEADAAAEDEKPAGDDARKETA